MRGSVGLDVLPSWAEPLRLGSIGDDADDGRRGAPASDDVPGEQEDLPYRVELWDQAQISVEQVLAVTASGAIGYAAYYAATRELPHRYITLRFKNSILARWNALDH